ncbi:MAG: Rpp14/Pop5 family protein [Candidatus Bathyarchaeia archaeon]
MWGCRMVKTTRKRYILFQTYPESSRFTTCKVHRAVQNSLLRLFGVYGLSQVNLALPVHSENKCFGVLRCSHKHVGLVKAALVFIREIEGKPVAFRVIRTSGTLKSLMEKLKGSTSYPLEATSIL